jgi:hypothetical protein
LRDLPHRRFTVEEFLAWEAEQEDDNTYELNDGQIVVKDGEPLLLGGKLMVMSAPSDAHQEIASNIAFAVEAPAGATMPVRAAAEGPGARPRRRALPAGRHRHLRRRAGRPRDADRGGRGALALDQGLRSRDEAGGLPGHPERGRDPAHGPPTGGACGYGSGTGVRWIVQDFIAASAVPLASVGVELPLDEVYEGVEV